jgi:peroxiredoxin
MSSIPGGSLLTFANSVVFNEVGESVKVASIWKTQTIIFIFLRHFGCVSCRSHAAQVWRDRQKYEGSGAKIVFIGNGTPHFIQVFKEDLGISDATIFTDPSLECFRAAGFKRGFLVSLGIRSIANGLGMFMKGSKQGPYTKATGDLWQLGGVLVVKSTGVVAYHYISEALGDYAPEGEVIENVD